MIYQSLWHGLIEVPPPQALMADIIREVAERHGLSVGDLVGKSHSRSIAWPRHEAMWECRMRTQQSFPAIGRKFNRDHSTVIIAVRKHAQRLGEV